jgi:hypothetical protein
LQRLRSYVDLARLLLLLDLEKQSAVDVRQDTSEGDCGFDEGIEFLVTTDGELQVAWRDALDLEVLCGVSSELEDFGGEVFEDGGEVDGGFGADARLLARDGAEVALYATAGELETSLGRVRLGRLNVRVTLASSLASGLSYELSASPGQR